MHALCYDWASGQQINFIRPWHTSFEPAFAFAEMVTLGTVRANMAPTTLVTERTRHSFNWTSKRIIWSKKSTHHFWANCKAPFLHWQPRSATALMSRHSHGHICTALPKVKYLISITSWAKNIPYPFWTGHEVVFIARRGIFWNMIRSRQSQRNDPYLRLCKGWNVDVDNIPLTRNQLQIKDHTRQGSMRRPMERAGDCGLISPPFEVTLFEVPTVSGISLRATRGSLSDVKTASSLNCGNGWSGASRSPFSDAVKRTTFPITCSFSRTLNVPIYAVGSYPARP